MTEQAEQFIDLAKKNRREFLEPYKAKFESSDSAKERAVIIIGLLKIEPSHLHEHWIAAEVVKWMRDIAFVDYLEQAFTTQTGRDRPTASERIREAKDFLLRDKIRRIREEENIGYDPAFKKLADSQMENPNSLYPGVKSKDGGYKKIQQRFYDSRKKIKPIEILPYPYWGYDVRVQNGRIVLFMVGAMSQGDGPRHPCTWTPDIDTLGSFPSERPHR